MDNNRAKTIVDFVDFCSQALGIGAKPRVKLVEDTSWALDRRSFGEYNPMETMLSVYVKNRNMADILRTIAHELVHHKQNELGMIKPGSGNTGSDIENQANSVAGIILREYGRMNQVIYENKLSEVFDRPYPFSLSRSGARKRNYRFKTDAGLEYVVSIELEDEAYWQVDFKQLGGPSGSKVGITGSGDAIRVFATVIEIIRDWVGRENPSLFYFSSVSNEPSRTRLYNTMINSLSLPGYRKSASPGPGTTEFIFIKTDK